MGRRRSRTAWRGRRPSGGRGPRAGRRGSARRARPGPSAPRRGECLPGAGGGGHGVLQSGARVRPGPGGRCPALPPRRVANPDRVAGVVAGALDYHERTAANNESCGSGPRPATLSGRSRGCHRRTACRQTWASADPGRCLTCDMIGASGGGQLADLQVLEAGRPAPVRTAPAGRAAAGQPDRRAARTPGLVDPAVDPAVPGLTAGLHAHAVPAGPAGGDLAAARAHRPRRPGPRPRGGRDRGPAGGTVQVTS
jgi:hypothetical protein